jgi:exopolysaccharide biosynthesis polyprenyl glycosylphosphotransferase
MATRLTSAGRHAERTFELGLPGAGLGAAGRSAGLLLAGRVVGDLAAIATAVGLAFALRFGLGVLELHEAPLDVRGHLAASLLWLVGLVWVMASHRLYDEDTLAERRGESARIRSSVVEGVAIVATAVFLFHLISVSRGWFLMVVVLSWGFLVAERRGARRMLARARARGHFRRAVVLVGAGGGEPDSDEFEVVARFAPGELAEHLDGLTSDVGRRWGVSATGILLQADTRPSDELWDLVVRAGGAGLPVYVASPVRSVATDRLTTREIDGRTIVKVAPPALIGVRAFEKRAFDIAMSTLGMILFAVPMVLIGVAVLVSSGRPVFYGQQRVGRAGRVFRMWKFRTMRRDAEAETGPVWATKDDPRRTKLGKVLRTWSLDELPQLWNVLTGDMSVVGPRPERPELVAEFVDGVTSYRHRHRIKPGITGLAQVSGLRGDTELAPRVDADNRYIEHWSLMLDVRLVARTVVAVLRRSNAG